jgi:circadian clock protein KaiB
VNKHQVISGKIYEQEQNEKMMLQLYITGASQNSLRAVANLKIICEKYLGINYELEIIDVYQQPEIAKHEQLIALPLLIKKYPFPEKRLVGDLSDTKKVLEGLGL